jgi:hypothetical protein
MTLLLGLVGSAQAAVYTYSSGFANGGVIPDADPNGWTDTRTISDLNPYAYITDIKVGLNISGGFNGDYYAQLTYTPATGGGSGFAVLLNRIGVTAGNNFGYANPGMSVTLDDSASANIHNYGGGGSGVATGTCQSDGRTINPNSSGVAFDAATPTATLANMGSQNLNANGTWTLFFADMSAGEQGTLTSWSLDLTVIPEPVNVALALLAGGAILFQLGRFLRSRRLVLVPARNNMTKIVSILLAGVFLTAITSFAAEMANVNPYQTELAAVAQPELPARAAELVKQAKVHDRQTAAANVVRAAVSLNPAAAPAVVGAIAHAVPEAAAIAAGVAASEQPKLAAAITRAAATAAPAKVAEIVAAVCRAVPNDYRTVAIAAAQAVPGSSKQILNAVASVLEPLNAGIQQALAAYGGNPPSVGVVLDSVKYSSQPPVVATVASSPGRLNADPVPTSLPTSSPTPLSSFVRGPGIGPPYIPLSGTPTHVNAGSGVNVGPGGRNYAAP